MKLEKLIEDFQIEKHIGSLDIEITGINNDSRKIKPGNVFVAIKGFEVDGHKFICDAIKKGAVAVVVEDNVEVDKNITLIKVEDTRLALAKFAAEYFEEPSKRMEMVGITGTNGKTTITYLINSILNVADKKTGIMGTNGNVIGGKLYKTENTTPESLIIQENLNKMLKEDTEFCMMEVSSHSLSLRRVEYTDFDIGIFTNLTKEHLDFHETMEDYFKSKLKLFYMTKKANIINIDDSYGKVIVDEVSKLDTPIVTYGIDNKADIFASNIEYHSKGVSFKLNIPGDSIDINFNIPGKFSVYNALAAASCGYVYGFKLDIIKKGLEKIKGVKGRFELVPTNRDFSVIIDFAHTADGLEKVLTTIEQFAQGRKIVVFGAGGNRDKTKRPVMGETVGKYADLCIVTSDNPRNEDPEKIIEDIIVGIKKVNGNYISIVNRKDAIRYALENAQSEDTILLAGKGHETYTIMKDKIIPFDERQIVLDILNEMK